MMKISIDFYHNLLEHVVPIEMVERNNGRNIKIDFFAVVFPQYFEQPVSFAVGESGLHEDIKSFD